MPYIICVNQPGCLPEADPTAVATIEEAREAATQECTVSEARFPGTAESGGWGDPKVWTPFEDAARELPESGGTIGPLPDGYVIDVRQVSLDELAGLAGCTNGAWSEGAILDAYNKN